MTLLLLEQLHIKVEILNQDSEVWITIHSSTFIFPSEFYIEPDASTAGYDVMISALFGIEVEIEGITKNSIQGEA